MKLSLFKKLFLLLFSTMLLLLGVIILAVHFNFKQGIGNFLKQSEQEKLQELSKQLGDYYQEHQSWNLFYDKEYFFDWMRHSSLAKNAYDSSSLPPQAPLYFNQPSLEFFQQPNLLHRPNHPPPKPSDREFFISLERIFIFDIQKQKITGPPEPIDINQEYKIPIFTGSVQVGWIILKENELITDQLLLSFIQNQLHGYLWVMGLVLLLSLGLSLLIAKQILLPINRISTQIHSLVKGDYSHQVLEQGNDELAKLTKNLNILSRVLDQTEKARQQWMADISHELRTPLAILHIELEAIVDGLRAPSPERIVSLEQEVRSLTRLVNDLYQLSLSDLGALDYQFEKVELVEQCKILVDRFQARFATRNLTLLFSSNCSKTYVQGDAMRLVQLFSNILENSYRYTNNFGMCRLTIIEQKQRILIQIDDSAPDVAREELPLLFERFHRVDKSRQRLTGGAGLGLAICQNIVKAHNGNIYATISVLGGLQINIDLPKL